VRLDSKPIELLFFLSLTLCPPTRSQFIVPSLSIAFGRTTLCCTPPGYYHTLLHSTMFCVVKATYQSEFRRFTLANIHLNNLEQDSQKLSYKSLHEKVC
jgi:hypothetical protein